MKVVLSAVLAFLVLQAASGVTAYNVRDLRCGICKAIVSEMKEAVSGVRTGITTNVGPHRLDEQGNLRSRAIPLAESEEFLTEAMEKACEGMEGYARGYDKRTGRIRVVKLLTSADKMNPEMEEIEPISDSDMNQSLILHCDDIVDVYEEDIIRGFRNGQVDSLCTRHADLCQTRDPHEL